MELITKDKLTNWQRRYLGLAEYVSLWSKDPSTKTGAVITTGDDKPISIGFNGLPKGVEDTEERLQNRELKYKMIVHCERNAAIFAARDLTGCTLYTFPFMSCSICAGIIVQTGIKHAIAPYSDNPRWQEDFALSVHMFNEAKVKLTLVKDWS